MEIPVSARPKAKPSNLPTFEPSNRVEVLCAALAVMLAVTLLISARLWLSVRDYPLVTVWSGLPHVPPRLDLALFAAMLVALGGSVVPALRRPCIVAVLAISAVWALSDQSRWQPYFVCYLVLFGALLLAPGRPDARRSEAACALTAIRLFLACLYGYAGLQKFNHAFVTSVFPWMIAPLGTWTHVPLAKLPAPLMTGWALLGAAGEMGSGLLLFSRRTCRFGAIYLMGMHLLLLGLLGPAGHNWNSVVWPWNGAMIAALWASCLGLRVRPAVDAAHVPCGADAARVPSKLEAALGFRTRAVCGAILIVFGVLPALSFWKLWDSYLSFSLYSGNTREMQLEIDPEDVPSLPPSARRVVDADGRLDLQQWSIADLNAVPYPEERIGRGVAEALARRLPSGRVRLVVEEKPDWWTGRRETRVEECGPAR